jgi:hypothetical protein
MSLESLSCNEATFRSKPGHEGSTLTVTLEGEATLDAVDILRRILEATHVEAERLHAKEVAMDLTQLEFLNSSGVKHFVSWLRRAAQLPEGANYRIRLVSSALVPWQRRGLDALRCFAPQLVTVETKPQ